MMTAEELRELAAAGVEIGAHTVSHPDLASLGFDECRREMSESREHLETLLGVPVRTFAYPFCSYHAEAVAAARDCGFDLAATCGRRGGWQRLELRRASITGKDGLPSFALKALGVYEPLFHSAPVRLLRVSTRALRARAREARERSR
jgi:peptidoglycan/xylan/chitin deacetylase (PgdA/CDA1 family)